MIGALNALQLVVVELLPHGEFHRIGWKRSTSSRLQRPVAAASPCPAACVARRPELMALTAAAPSHVTLWQQSVSHDFAVTFLEPEAVRIAQDLFSVAGSSSGSIDPRHIYAMQQPRLAEPRIRADDDIEDRQHIHLGQIEHLPRKAAELARRVGSSRVAESVVIASGAAGLVGVVDDSELPDIPQIAGLLPVFQASHRIPEARRV